MTFVDFDIYYRMVSLRKLYSVTLIYSSKVKDSNHSGDRPLRRDDCE